MKRFIRGLKIVFYLSNSINSIEVVFDTVGTLLRELEYKFSQFERGKLKYFVIDENLFTTQPINTRADNKDYESIYLPSVIIVRKSYLESLFRVQNAIIS